MWRTAKADVAGELGIPPQTSQMSQLSFGAIGVAHAPGDNVCYCLAGPKSSTCLQPLSPARESLWLSISA